MSGGHFDYQQYRINDIVTGIEEILTHLCDKPESYCSECSECGYCGLYNFSKETIKEFEKGIILLKKAGIYAQRIDWLISDDDGEETFHKRLKDDLSKLIGSAGIAAIDSADEIK